MNNLNINFEKLNIISFMNLINDENALNFCLDYGLIDQTRICSCGNCMKIYKKSNQKHGYIFFCDRTSCKKTTSILKDTWFSKSKLSLTQCLLCIGAYANELHNNQFTFYTCLNSSATIVNWKAYFRDLCMNWVENRPFNKIGGLGMTVEIDESMIFKRKNRVGRLLVNEENNNWLFGGYCRETREIFIVSVRNRSAETLLQAIVNNINIGTRIISDSWRSYRNIYSLGFNHSMINHSLNFIDPLDPTIYTQNIERLWRSIKSIIPKSASSAIRFSYYSEFLFKYNNNWWELNIGMRIKLILDILKDIRFD